MAAVIFDGVTKSYGDVLAVDDLDLAIEDGEFMVLLGPSGCGKTTALRMIAGPRGHHERRCCGSATAVVNDVEPAKRDIAMVFQSYALYPHMTVAKNIESPARHGPPPSTARAERRKLTPAERNERIDEAARMLGLEPYLDRKPAALSGGQRQRVALARAVVRRPAVFLMDEPLSNLDAKLRAQTRAELVDLHRRLGTTFVYVTHDQVEAMTMADRIAVLDDGRLQQVGTPARSTTPANLFVARFIGTPPMNTAGRIDGEPIRCRRQRASLVPGPRATTGARWWSASARAPPPRPGAAVQGQGAPGRVARPRGAAASSRRRRQRWIVPLSRPDPPELGRDGRHAPVHLFDPDTATSSTRRRRSGVAERAKARTDRRLQERCAAAVPRPVDRDLRRLLLLSVRAARVLGPVPQQRGGTNLRYVGWEQYTDVLGGEEFREASWHSVQYVLFTVPAGLVLGTLLAVAAHRRLRGIKVFQAIFTSTVATSMAVASVVFLVLINPQIGVYSGRRAWLGDHPENLAAMFGVSLSSIWQNLGLSFIIVLAGLRPSPTS